MRRVVALSLSTILLHARCPTTFPPFQSVSAESACEDSISINWVETFWASRSGSAERRDPRPRMKRRQPVSCSRRLRVAPRGPSNRPMKLYPGKSSTGIRTCAMLVPGSNPPGVQVGIMDPGRRCEASSYLVLALLWRGLSSLTSGSSSDRILLLILTIDCSRSLTCLGVARRGCFLFLVCAILLGVARGSCC